MAKPANFPERKRQRQIRAMRRLKAMTKGKPNSPPQSNHEEFEVLKAAVQTSKRHVRTKKDRSAQGRFGRSA